MEERASRESSERDLQLKRDFQVFYRQNFDYKTLRQLKREQY